MDFLAHVPRSLGDQGPDNAEKPKMQGEKILSVFNYSYKYIKLNHTKTCMYAWKSFSCGDLVRVNSSVILIHFILKDKTK